MGNGFIAGGVAEGLRELPQNIQRSAAIRLQQEQLAQTGKFNQQRIGLQERGLAIKEQAAADEAKRNQIEKVDAALDKALTFISESGPKLLASGKTPAEARAILTPFIEGARAAATRLGRDPAAVDARLDTVFAIGGTGDPAFEGTGFPAQARNTLIELSGKIAKGIPLTGAQKRAFALARDEVTKPRVVGSPSTGFSIIQPTLDPSLFPDLGTAPAVAPTATPSIAAPQATATQPAAPSPAAAAPPTAASGGTTVTPLSGAQSMKANEAGRSSMIVEATKSAFAVRDAIVNPDGTVNRDLIFTMNTDIPVFGTGVPFSEGRTVRSKLKDAISTKLRLETGAAQNDSEIENVVDRFAPSLLDSTAGVIDKMNRLTAFFEGTLSRTDPELFAKLTARAREEGNIPEPPPDEAGAEFMGFDPSSGVAVFQRADGTSFGIRGQNGGAR